MNVYLLSHARQVESDTTDSKIIGVYSSLEKINMAINKYKDIVGFKDYPDDFITEDYEVKSLDEKEIFQNRSIYFLQHEYSDDGYDYVTNIGIFMNYNDAKKVMEELKKSPKYIEKTDGLYADENGFNIDEYLLDEDHWTEGFVDTDEV